MKPWRGVLLALAAIALGGCGLEVVPVLEPPGTPTTPATPTTPLFQIVYTTANDQPEFRGFELYYKLYDSTQAKDETLGTLSDLAAKGFKPILGTGDTLLNHVRPLVSVAPSDRAAAFTSVADYSEGPTLQAVPAIDYSGAATGPGLIAIYRQAPDSSGNPKSFAAAVTGVTWNYLQTDPDLATVGWSQVQTDKSVDIVIYAFAFGLQDYSTPLYSAAVYLGYTTIRLP